MVEGVLRLARVGRHDVVYDRGSGDGRIVITVAKRYGARGVGVELDTHLISVANLKAREAGVADRDRFLRQNLFTTDLSSATVVTMFLRPVLHRRLRPTLYRSLRPGTRIVSHAWDMGEWEADAQEEVDGRELFYWMVPANVAGVWRWRAPDGRANTLLLEQRYQRVSGSWLRGGARRGVSLRRPRARWRAPRHRRPQRQAAGAVGGAARRWRRCHPLTRTRGG